MFELCSVCGRKRACHTARVGRQYSPYGSHERNSSAVHKTRTLAAATCLAFSLLACLVLSAQSLPPRIPRHLARAHAQSSCSGQPKDCKLPTRYLGEKDGCACFTCEYGKKTQRVICTNNKRDRDSMMSKVRQSTPKKAVLK